ncbi:hypothetical protein IT415_03930 [bacterium]|nr:hypothetical protein [bacterium]
MQKLQLYYYVPTIILTFVLGLIVFVNNPKKLTNRVFLLFSLAMLGWLSAQFVADIIGIAEESLIFIRIAVAISIFLGFSFVALIDALANEGLPNKRLWISSMIIFVTLMPISFIPSTVESVQIRDWGVEATYGDTYFVLLIYSASVFVYTLFLAFFRRARRSSRSRTQLRFVYLGIASALIVNLFGNFILLPFGLSQQLGVAMSITSVLLIVGSTGFAILKHRLFDIRAVVARSIAYLFSVLLFAFVYGFLAYGVAQNILLRNILTTERSQQIFNIILAVILAFTFPTIRRFFEKITDRIFYRDRYDPQHLMSSIGRILATEIALEPLTTKVIRVLEDEMRLADANIVVLGKKGEDGEKDSETEKAIYYQTHGAKKHQDYQIQDLQTIRLPVVITDELASSDERQILEQHHIRAAFVLKTRESQVGYLLLGDKRSGDIYSDQDIQTLRIIADELAVAIQNARAYTEIQRFNVTLREKIDQATHELKHANHELKALDKAKDEFISMASHQLRTPLTAVRGYTSMVMDGDFGKISGEQKDTLKQAFDAATRMTRLVDDLLNVSRIQSGKFRLERAEVDLNKVLPEEVSLLDTTAKTKQVAITYNPPKTPVPTLLIDEGKTRQCLMNLMDNSIYYSSTVEGGGKVQVYLESDATHVIFRVVDNGIGVPKAQQPKLFKKFYRAPNAQKTRPDGTGLGLFLVGKVVRDQGGEIIFESEEGKGSTFGFRLPIKAAGEGVDASGKVVGAASVEKDASPKAISTTDKVADEKVTATKTPTSKQKA